MCIQWTRVVITRQYNPPISQFNSPCQEFTRVWSMFVYNNVSDDTHTLVFTRIVVRCKAKQDELKTQHFTALMPWFLIRKKGLHIK